jgi:hypothetical protein
LFDSAQAPTAIAVSSAQSARAMSSFPLRHRLRGVHLFFSAKVVPWSASGISGVFVWFNGKTPISAAIFKLKCLKVVVDIDLFC